MTAEAQQLFQAFLEEKPEIAFVRYQWLDFSGVLRQRTLTKHYCLRLLVEKRYYEISPGLMLFRISDAEIDERPRQEAYQLIPDWGSLRPCFYAPGHASVMCFAYCPEAEEPAALCPRQLLLNVLQESLVEHRISLLVGFEVEFQLLQANLKVSTSVDEIEGWSTAAGLRGPTLRLIEEIVNVLQSSGIEVQHYHAEERQQLEISTGPDRPMEAIDALLYTYETIRTLAIKYGMKASMAPRASTDRVLNGAHVHISMQPVDVQEEFIAGILSVLPMLCVFGMPSYDSYLRVHETMDTLGTLVGWGTQNRHLPIRKISDGHWELRCADATANFYLFLASTIAAGLQGIQEHKKLHWKDVRRIPVTMSAEELTEHGVMEHLPRSLEESLILLRADSMTETLLGPHMKKRYLEVKSKDEEALKKLSEEERRRLYVRYF